MADLGEVDGGGVWVDGDLVIVMADNTTPLLQCMHGQHLGCELVAFVFVLHQGVKVLTRFDRCLHLINVGKFMRQAEEQLLGRRGKNDRGTLPSAITGLIFLRRGGVSATRWSVDYDKMPFCHGSTPASVQDGSPCHVQRQRSRRVGIVSNLNVGVFDSSGEAALKELEYCVHGRPV